MEKKKNIMKPGDVVWAKLAHYPFWPSRIVKLSEVKSRTTREQLSPEQPGSQLVFFFGSHNYSWVPESAVSNYSDNFEEYSKNTRAKQSFQKALKEAERWMNKQKNGQVDSSESDYTSSSESEESTTEKRGPGRPPKKRPKKEENSSSESENDDKNKEKKKRGRPPKKRKESSSSSESEGPGQVKKEKRKPGRPPKKKISEEKKEEKKSPEKKEEKKSPEKKEEKKSPEKKEREKEKENNNLNPIKESKKSRLLEGFNRKKIQGDTEHNGIDDNDREKKLKAESDKEFVPSSPKPTDPCANAIYNISRHPVSKYYKFNVTSYGKGTATAKASFSSARANSIYEVHPSIGALYYLLDLVCYSALVSTLSENETAITQDIHVTVLNPIPQGSDITLKGKVQQSKSNLSFIDGEVYFSGKLMVVARVIKWTTEHSVLPLTPKTSTP